MVSRRMHRVQQLRRTCTCADDDQGLGSLALGGSHSALCMKRAERVGVVAGARGQAARSAASVSAAPSGIFRTLSAQVS